MCLTCGWMDAHKEMGQKNITFETLTIMDRTREGDREDHPQEYAIPAQAPR